MKVRSVSFYQSDIEVAASVSDYGGELAGSQAYAPSATGPNASRKLPDFAQRRVRPPLFVGRGSVSFTSFAVFSCPCLHPCLHPPPLPLKQEDTNQQVLAVQHPFHLPISALSSACWRAGGHSGAGRGAAAGCASAKPHCAGANAC